MQHEMQHEIEIFLLYYAHRFEKQMQHKQKYALQKEGIQEGYEETPEGYFLRLS